MKPQNSPVWKAQSLKAGFSSFEGRVLEMNFEVAPGERVALLGSDHLTRALLVRVLTGLRPLRDGQLLVLGELLPSLNYWEDWDHLMPQHLRRQMGVCLENEGLLNNVSTREGMELLLRFKSGDHTSELRKRAADVVTETCSHFGLADALDKRPVQLTGAQKRLAGLARAFMGKPPVLVFENPSIDIGDFYREQLFTALEHMLRDPDRTVLISTEDWALAWRFCSRWMIVDQGEISFDGSPKDFFKSRHPLLLQIQKLSHLQRSFEALLQEAA